MLADRASHGDVVRRKAQCIVQASQPQRTCEHDSQIEAASLLKQLDEAFDAENVEYVPLPLVEGID
jgi:hypothetical protein